MLQNTIMLQNIMLQNIISDIQLMFSPIFCFTDWKQFCKYSLTESLVSSDVHNLHFFGCNFLSRFTLYNGGIDHAIFSSQ